MSSPEPDASKSTPKSADEALFLLYPWWVLLSSLVLIGAYAGWWGAELVSWPGGLGLVGAVVCLGCLCLFLEWLFKAHRIARPWRGLLVVVAVYGLFGGLVLGIMFLPFAFLLAGGVASIANEWLRLAAGVGVGVLMGCAAVAYAARRRARQPAEQPSPDQWTP
jgi:hypothetical protein